jgi:dTDP-4-dehydrorhamnose reductase
LNPEPRVWITGAGGLLGSHLLRSAPHGNVTGLTREMLDLTDFAAVARRFATDRPTLIIHAAALSKSPMCQARPALARQINVTATQRLAALAQDIGFIFFSTDQVFDGAKGNYAETDPLHPLNIYGETKAAAEEAVLKNPRHTVVRLALCGGISPKGGASFNEELAAAWQQDRTVKLFADEFRSPLVAPVAARAVWELAERQTPGIFHLGGGERLSRLDLGKLVAARHPELSPRFEAVSLSTYQGAPRAPDTSLCCTKIQGLLSFRLPGLGQWLTENPDAPF